MCKIARFIWIKAHIIGVLLLETKEELHCVMMSIRDYFIKFLKIENTKTINKTYDLALIHDFHRNMLNIIVTIHSNVFKQEKPSIYY